MYRIRLHGRGGQGTKTASRILGTAFFIEGLEVQDAPRYGAERRGAPIFAYVRAAHKPINERGIISHPDLVVVSDDTLIGMPAAGVMQGVDENTVLLINTHETEATWQHRLNTGARIFILPAKEHVEDRAALPYVGSRCAAAAAALTGAISRDTVSKAVQEELGHLGEDIVAVNQAEALAAFDAMHPHAGSVREGVPIAASGYHRPEWIDVPFETADISAPAIHAAATSVEVRTGLWRTMRPVIDYDKCSRCWWVCSTYCPDGAINVSPEGAPEIDYDHCKGCLICVAQCPPHAIMAIAEHAAQQQETSGAAT